MRDRIRIAAGLLVFVALVSLPIWYNAASGTSGTAPTLARPTGERCILPKDEMRASHMDLLVDWRERVVRRQERRFVGPDGAAVEISLAGTCLGCHGGKREFCDRCHEFAGVRTTCFDCHVDRERPAAPAPAPAVQARLSGGRP